MILEGRPDFKEIEVKWIKKWEEEDLYKFDMKKRGKLYKIDTPPPTISGHLHIGHAYSYTQAEFIARYRRMAGWNVFYPMVFDKNGLPTERLTEKTLNVKSKDLPREEFIKLCLERTEEGMKEYSDVWKRIGISCDWSQLYSTISERVQRMSQRSFLRLNKMGRLYRKEMPSLWCPACRTAVAQVDLEDKEIHTTFNYLTFKLEGKESIEIATTRPELLPACVAIFINPKDERAPKLVGKKAQVPLFGFKVPILADERVDPAKGTGIVICCSFGDLTDIEWFKAHKLPLKTAIDESGVMTKLAGKYEGLGIKAARAQIIEDLKAEGSLIRQDPLTHEVKFHDCHKCEIEFRITKQWFVKYLDLRKQMLKLGKQVNWWPKHMRSRYDNWVKGLQWDWCISRQRYYGIPIPAWYCKKCGETLFADEKDLPVNPLKDKPKKCKCGSNQFEPDADVLDTWATSSLTCLINSHWEEDPKWFSKMYPMTLRANAHDIITFWDFNSMIMDWLQTGKLPFTDIMVSGHGLDAKGDKMSKSLGNITRPLDVVDKYCADALRYWGASAKLGDDLKYKDEDVAKGMHLLIKIWNASRFVSQHIKKSKTYKPTIIDKWILYKLNETIKDSTAAFEKCEYSKAKHITESFFWNMCDFYLEMVKYRLFNDKDKAAAQHTLYVLLDNLLRLFAPFVPFITEELHTSLFRSKSVHTSSWPKYDKKLADSKAFEAGELACKIISSVRKWKQSKNMSLGAEVDSLEIQYPEKLDKILDVIKGTMRIKDLIVKKGKLEVK